MALSILIEKIKAVAKFSPEFETDEELSSIRKSYQDLLELYPALTEYPAYLEFLRLTGGAHIHNADFSLGIYGFGGEIVTSFEEGLFLDSERYFLFGEVLYLSNPDEEFALAFDFDSKQDLVYISPIGESDYTLCADSFLELLEKFSTGAYPGQSN